MTWLKLTECWPTSGVSFHHFDDTERGFSFRFDGPLDMRMNRRAGRSAADPVNTLPEERIAEILYIYGELKQSRRMARSIVKARSESPCRQSDGSSTPSAPTLTRAKRKKNSPGCSGPSA